LAREGSSFPLWKRGNEGDLRLSGKNLPQPLFYKEGSELGWPLLKREGGKLAREGSSFPLWKRGNEGDLRLSGRNLPRPLFKKEGGELDCPL